MKEEIIHISAHNSNIYIYKKQHQNADEKYEEITQYQVCW